MRDANDAANNFLGTKSIEATFFFKGGATTKWLWSVELCQQFDCIILAIGSNELAKCTIEQLQDSLNHYASYLIHQQFTCNVIIMGLWPRKSQSFSIRARLFNKIGKHQMYWTSGVLFWNWSRKLTYQFCDDVHLMNNAYKRALKYLISPVQILFPYQSK